MSDSGQQPTAGSEIHTMVNYIFDMMMSDMQIRKIDIGSLGQYFTILLHEVASLQPESVLSACANLCRSCRRQCKNDSNAAADDKPDSSAATAAIGHTHGELEGEVEGEQQGGVYRGAGAEARVCTVREDTKAKCEAILAFGLV